MKKTILLAGLLLGVAVLSANTTGVFLNFPVSTRQAALGGAFGAVCGDIDAAGFNPAGLTKIDGFAMSFLYDSQLFGNNYGRMTLVHPAGFGMLGISFGAVSIPFDQTFDFGAAGGGRILLDYSLAVMFQRDIFENLSLGMSAKMISMDLGTPAGSRTSVAADAGLLYLINPKSQGFRMNIGTGVRNLGLDFKFDESSESLPTTFYGALMVRPISLMSFYAETDLPKGMNLEVCAGMEFDLFNFLKPRLGYRTGNGLSNLSAGLGLSKEFGSTTLALDYGINLGVENSHLIGLKIQRPALLEAGKTGKRIPYDGKNPSRITVNKLECRGTDNDLGETAADWLRIDLTSCEQLSLLDPGKTIGTIPNQGDGSMKAQYLITGSINYVGSEYYIELKVVNAVTGKVETASEETAGNKAALRLAIRRLALKLSPAGK